MKIVGLFLESFLWDFVNKLWLLKKKEQNRHFCSVIIPLNERLGELLHNTQVKLIF